MADILTTINGEPTTLIDNGDGTYRIDLGTSDARKFVRGELQQLRAEKQEAIEDRDNANRARQEAIAVRDLAIAERDALNVRIAEINTNIDELVAWLQSQGDPT